MGLRLCVSCLREVCEVVCRVLLGSCKCSSSQPRRSWGVTAECKLTRDVCTSFYPCKRDCIQISHHLVDEVQHSLLDLRRHSVRELSSSMGQ